MPNKCSYCQEVRPAGGTKTLVLNDGELWIEFCPPCGDGSTMTNAETGESLTVKQLYDRSAVGKRHVDPSVPNHKLTQAMGGVFNSEYNARFN